MKRVALVVLALTAAGCGGSGGPSRWTVKYRSCADQSPPCIDSFHMADGSPSRSERAALTIVARMRAATSLVVRRGAHLRSSFDWKTLDGKPIGVALKYAYRNPIHVDQVLPYVETPPDAPAHGDCVQPYASGWLKIASDSVTGLWIYVDMRKRAVVDISPYVDEGVVHYAWVPGKPHPRCEEDTPGG
jgi:hypothetical protein